MTNEEAAKRLETRVHWDIEFICCDQEDFTENLDAIEVGAAALRRLDELEKWAGAWENYYAEGPNSWPNTAGFYKNFIVALHGEREWPKEGK